MKRILLLSIFINATLVAQWKPFTKGAILSNQIGNKHLVIENEDGPSPVKYYLSGEYSPGLQFGRDDKMHKISFLTKQVLFTNVGRHLVIENDDALKPIKLYLSGEYSPGLQFGRDDKAHKISFSTKQVLFTNAGRHLVMENDSPLKPIKLYLSGDYTRGLQIGRDDMLQKISLRGKVGIDTENLDGWKLAVNGNIRAKEIKVETDWADFVFEKEYNLATLKEVESHIIKNGHLKDIPSASEVKKNGIYLGEMNSKLLQKIEELTLYTIQQQKEIERLKLVEVRLSKIEKLLERQK